MNSSHLIPQYHAPVKGAVESVELFDNSGNCAAAAIWKIGPETFELYLFDYNSSVPRRSVGSLAMVKAQYNAFFHRKIEEGFQAPQIAPTTQNIN